jgi:hypothetical protein
VAGWRSACTACPMHDAAVQLLLGMQTSTPCMDINCTACLAAVVLHAAWCGRPVVHEFLICCMTCCMPSLQSFLSCMDH